MKKPYRYLTLGQSLLCALKGLRFAVRTQRNLRLQLFLGAVTLTLAGVAQLDAVRLALLLLTVALVLVTEVLNTALEALVDSLYPEYNTAAARVKDVAAGAALLAALGAVATGVATFWGAWEAALPQRLAQGGMAVAVAALLLLAFPRLATHGKHK